MTKRDAEKAVMNVALDTNFAVPGDAGFPLNQAFEAPRDRNEAETMRQYLMQVRQELAARLLTRVYANDNTPSKVRYAYPRWITAPDAKFSGG
jgi:actin related protein 2/3 complex, subunit 3